MTHIQDNNRPQRPQIKYKKPKPQLDLVCEAILEMHGLTAQAAAKLDMSEHNLRLYIKHHPKAQAAQKEARRVMGDFTEGKFFNLIKDKHWPAIQYYLSTQCKDRGYVLPKGTALNTGDTTNMIVQNVIINAIESGKFEDPLGEPAAGGTTIEGEMTALPVVKEPSEGDA
jgi:hypothetical protein